MSGSERTERSEDPMWTAWLEAAPRIYDEVYYEANPLVSYFNLAGHVQAERPFAADAHFGQVLEVGAGTGMHFSYVKHRFDRYIVTDINDALLDKARERIGEREDVVYENRDATALGYPDNFADRLISIYNLEHLPEPHRVLEEWRRVVKPGGVVSISIPTEGGFAWNGGRFLTTRRSFARKGLNLDYIIAREHINACYRLASLIRHYFPERRECWFPTRIPTPHVNLVYTATLRVTK